MKQRSGRCCLLLGLGDGLMEMHYIILLTYTVLENIYTLKVKKEENSHQILTNSHLRGQAL